MRVKNKLINDLAAIPEIRSFSKDLRQGVNSSLVLTSHAAVSCFIAAISLSNKLVAFSDDAFGLYPQFDEPFSPLLGSWYPGR